VVSLTIDKLNPELLTRLHSETQRRGVDVTVLVKEMIQDKLGPVTESCANQTYHDLDALAGTWSAEDAVEFLADVAEMRPCDGNSLAKEMAQFENGVNQRICHRSDDTVNPISKRSQ
jgi:hypothetical protein